MADPEHLSILDRGVDAWNAFRREAPGVLPDLSAADLSHRDLAGADLRDARLEDADLRGADLSASDLTDARLERANLTGARLVGSRLAGVHLTRARLDGVVLVDDPFSEGAPEHLEILCRGLDAWLDWRHENPDVTPELPDDAFLAKLLKALRVEAEADDAAFEGDPEHLSVLRSGVDAWNAWRQENPDVTPELDGAHLAGADLRGADLIGASLNRAHLSRADLSYARLLAAQLYQANLVAADLTQAELYGTHLEETYLAGSRLSRARLADARISGADFFEGDPRQLALLFEDADGWNAWRRENPDVQPDLRGASLIGVRKYSDADLSGANLARAHLSGCDWYKARLSAANLAEAKLIGSELFSAELSGACFAMADLTEADLSSADLTEAFLGYADLSEAELRSADLTGADLRAANLTAADLSAAKLRGANLAAVRLSRARLTEADLTEVDLTEADLEEATLVRTVLDGAALTGSRVYGVSAWSLDLSRVGEQSSLVITRYDEATVTVDNLEVAQFVYMMLHNEKIRGIIDTIGCKGVLILGRFYGERKAVLDALRERLREFDLVPMVFDWDKPTSRDLTETVALLANMSRFVVADVTDAKSIPQELAEIVPRLPSVPVRPIILKGDRAYAMFEHWKGYPTMLPVYEYEGREQLIDNVEEAILVPVREWEAADEKKLDLEERLKAKDEELKARDEEIVRLQAALKARDAAG